MIRYSFLHMLRNKKQTGLLFVLILLLTIIFGGYEQTIIKIQGRIASVYDKIPVTGQIIGRNPSEEIQIPYSCIEPILDTGFVKHASLFARDIACVIDPPIGAWVDKNVIESYPEIVGVYDIADETWYSQIRLHFMDGYDENCFRQKEAVCVIYHELLDEFNIHLGDTIRMIAMFHYKDYANRSEMVGPSYKVVGTFELLNPINKNGWNITEKDTIVPFQPYMKQLIKLYDDVIPSNDLESKLCVSSASFEFQKKEQLKEFRLALMQTDFGKPLSDIKDVKMKRLKFELNDNELNNLVTPLTRSLQTLYRFVPIIIAMLALVSLFLAYLFVKKCIYEISLMRSLGRGKKIILLSLLLELTMPGIVAIAIAYLIFYLIGDGMISISYSYFFLCFVVNTIFCLLYQLAKPMEGLKLEGKG